MFEVAVISCTIWLGSLAEGGTQPGNLSIKGSQIELGVLGWAASNILQTLEDMIGNWRLNGQVSSLRLEPIGVGAIHYSILYTVRTGVGEFSSSVGPIWTGLLSGNSIARLVPVAVSSVGFMIRVL